MICIRFFAVRKESREFTVGIIHIMAVMEFLLIVLFLSIHIMAHCIMSKPRKQYPAGSLQKI